MNQLPKRARELLTSWRVVTAFGATLTVAGVVYLGAIQAPISLAQASSVGYGAVSAASTGGTPITGAGLAASAIVLLVGMIAFGIGLYLRRSSAQTAN